VTDVGLALPGGNRARFRGDALRQGDRVVVVVDGRAWYGHAIASTSTALAVDRWRRLRWPRRLWWWLERAWRAAWR